MTGAFNIFTDWKTFIKLLLSIMIPLEKQTNEPSEYDGLNSVILSKPSNKKNQSQDDCSHKKLPISTQHKCDNMVEVYDDSIDVLNLFCLSNFACIYCHSEWFFASGELLAPPEIMLLCFTQCQVELHLMVGLNCIYEDLQSGTSLVMYVKIACSQVRTHFWYSSEHSRDN